MPPSMRLIQYELGDGTLLLPQFFASNSAPRSARFEAAGHAFHAAALRFLGFNGKIGEEQEEEDAAERKNSSSGYSSSFKGKKVSQQDHYALLGLSHLRFLATEEQIRKAYREVALKHHPDKQAALILLEETEEAKEAKKQEIDSHFKAIQEAYEVLVDPLKRRNYDSVDEFDDEVPGDCPAEDFFKVYGPVFMRNGRWSVTQPVPELGKDETEMAAVDGFYDFWFSFKSWREFPHADEFDIEQAEGREHKRWMERQNLKLREKAKKEESARVRSLVENAYKKDPRIVRRREEEKAEKLRKKMAKILAKKEKEDQAAKAVEDERLRKEAEEKRLAEEAAAQKKIKEKEKKLIRKERSRLRSLSAAVVSSKSFGVKDEDVETLCSTMDLEKLRSLCEKMETSSNNSNGVNDQASVLRQALEVTSGERLDPVVEDCKQQQQSEAPQMMMKSDQEKKDRPWTQPEVELLRKAMNKYPKGTSQRWEVVSSYIGTGRSVEEILKAIKTVLLQKPDSSRVFDTFLQKRKAPNNIASPLSTRIADGELPGEANGVVISNGEAKTAGKTAGTAGKTAGTAGKTAGTAGKTAGTAGTAGKTAGTAGNGLENGEKAAAVEDDSNVAAAGGEVVEEEVWSEVQELALVKALKTFPKETAQRWDRIAAAVPGKSRAQCFKKFAALRESFRSKK